MFTRVHRRLALHWSYGAVYRSGEPTTVFSSTPYNSHRLRHATASAVALCLALSSSFLQRLVSTSPALVNCRQPTLRVRLPERVRHSLLSVNVYVRRWICARPVALYFHNRSVANGNVSSRSKSQNEDFGFTDTVTPFGGERQA
jgi:hypothetical protein